MKVPPLEEVEQQFGSIRTVQISSEPRHAALTPKSVLPHTHGLPRYERGKEPQGYRSQKVTFQKF